MYNRNEEVTEAFNKMFEWAYSDPGLNIPWSSFNLWLQESQGIYWVNGKAGSGKSTLMRYLLENPRTGEELRLWGGEVTVHTASFFFWNSGTVEQRSVNGLRSILYDILESRPLLIRHVLPELWDLETTVSVKPNSKAISQEWSWTFRKLKKAFQRLAEQDIDPLKLCLFIDGLDEYDGEFADVADFCYYLAKFPNVKICASSRPHVIFEEVFEKMPTLRLQDLTFDDIKLFVEGKLHHHKGMVDLVRIEPEEALELVNGIVEAANGVFLWVKLAVDSLLEGLTRRDRINDL